MNQSSSLSARSFFPVMHGESYHFIRLDTSEEYQDPIGTYSAARHPGVRADGPPSDDLLPGYYSDKLLQICPAEQ